MKNLDSVLNQVKKIGYKKEKLAKTLDAVLKEAIEDCFLDTTGSHAGEAVVEEIFDIVKSTSNYPECNDADIEIAVNNWLVSIKEDNDTTIEDGVLSRYFNQEESNNTCDHCGGEALLETKNPSQTSGDICDICGEWVCQDCLDHSKCGVDYDNVCQKCSKEMEFQKALDNLEQVKKDYYSDGLRHKETAFSHASAMADAINDLLRAYNN